MSHKITDNWQKYLRDGKLGKVNEVLSKDTYDAINKKVDEFGYDVEGLYELVLKIFNQMGDSEVSSMLGKLREGITKEQLATFVAEKVLDKFDGDYQRSIVKPKKLKEDEMEGSMHRTALAILIQDAQDLLAMIKDSDDLPEWLESKITKAKDYIAGSKNYMVGQVARAQGALEEKAVSKAQQRFMGMVKNCKETGDCPSSEVEKAADSMTGKEVDDFAGTKHKGLPNKKEELRNRIRETIISKLNEGCCGCSPEPIEEAEYKGKKVKLNDPIRTSGESKKFKVYVKNDKGNVVVVRFGDPDMEIRRDNPEARKNFRKRHNCADKTDKTTAGYWSCWQWRAKAKVDS